MGNVKRGNNSYVVLTAVTSGNMATEFAALGNVIIFYKKASTTPNAVSATQSYANNNPFPSYSSAAAGDIISIAGLTAEVDIAVLGEANVGSFGGEAGYSDYQTFTTTAGLTTFTLVPDATTSEIPPSDANKYQVFINGNGPFKNGDSGLSISLSGLSGSNRTATLLPAGDNDGDLIKFRWELTA